MVCNAMMKVSRGRWTRHVTVLAVIMTCVSVKMLFLPSNIQLQITYEQLDTRVNLTAHFHHSPDDRIFNYQQIYNARSTQSTRDINCQALFNRDLNEIDKAKDYLNTHTHSDMDDVTVIDRSRDCARFTRERGYIMTSLSDEEKGYPLAYSILFYTNIGQLERLLRTIYTPHNHYCIHLDSKTPTLTRQAMTSLTRCFPNVFISSRMYDVWWGHISLLHAELSCMRDLLHYDWRYLISATAQNVPLRTNHELVTIFKLFGTANDVQALTDNGVNSWYTRYVLRWRLVKTFNKMLFTLHAKDKPPYNLTIQKGLPEGSFSRPFVEYMVKSHVGQTLLQWLGDTGVPDETFWATLNYNPSLRAPGSYLGNINDKPYLTRYTVWYPSANMPGSSYECNGQWVRRVCIFGVGDLYRLYDRPEFFANKFNLDSDWLAYDCMEQLVLNKTLARNPALTLRNLTNYYSNLNFVKDPTLIV